KVTLGTAVAAESAQCIATAHKSSQEFILAHSTILVCSYLFRLGCCGRAGVGFVCIGAGLTPDYNTPVLHGIKACNVNWRPIACSPNEFSICEGRWDRNRTCTLRLWRKRHRILPRLILSL